MLAFVNYFSVLLLSNWGPMLLVTYLIMGAVAGLVCLGDYWQKENTAGKKAIQILCLPSVLYRLLSGTDLRTTVQGEDGCRFYRGVEELSEAVQAVRQ